MKIMSKIDSGHIFGWFPTTQDSDYWSNLGLQKSSWIPVVLKSQGMPLQLSLSELFQGISLSWPKWPSHYQWEIMNHKMMINFRYGKLSDHGKLWNEWDNMWDGKLRIDKLCDLYDDQNIRW